MMERSAALRSVNEVDLIYCTYSKRLNGEHRHTWRKRTTQHPDYPKERSASPQTPTHHMIVMYRRYPTEFNIKHFSLSQPRSTSHQSPTRHDITSITATSNRSEVRHPLVHLPTRCMRVVLPTPRPPQTCLEMIALATQHTLGSSHTVCHSQRRPHMANVRGEF